MNILVINCGSSSIKYQIIETEKEEMLCKGLVELAGDKSTFAYTKTGSEKMTSIVPFKDHADGVAHIIKTITDPEIGCIKDASDIAGIGHRVVQGADKYASSVLIDDDVKAALEEFTPLAPLHNPANLVGIAAAEKAMPGVPNVGVFDTAFHQTMEPEAFLYAVPYEYYKENRVRKYGFHGTSHRYISLEAPAAMGKKPEEIKMICCHIGNGASLAAIKNGKCIDTTMGLTPLEGLMMGTRAGDIDTAIVTYLMEQKNMTADEVLNVLNKKSGLLGIFGESDMRAVDAAAAEGNEMAETALRMYARRIRGYIGNYFVQLGGADAIVFTAGVGENDDEMRERVCEGLESIGIVLDKEKNKVRGTVDVTAADSKVKILVIPTNEELMIARDTAEIVAAL